MYITFPIFLYQFQNSSMHFPILKYNTKNQNYVLFFLLDYELGYKLQI